MTPKKKVEPEAVHAFGRIPRRLTLAALLVPALIICALAAALCLISYPPGSGTSLLRHLLESLHVM